MTVPISPESPRRAAARRYALALRRVMVRDGLSQRQVAEAAGIQRSRIANWLLGTNLPSLEVASRMAEALGEPDLLGIVTEARRGRCPVCGKSWVSSAGGPRRFCSGECQGRAERGRRAHGPARDRAIAAERRLELVDHAVAEYCAGCEPEGLCRDSTCALRPISPLRLDVRRAVA